MRVLSLGFALLAFAPGAALAQEALPFFDARAGAVPHGPARAVVASARVHDARQRLARRLGPQGVVQVDASTGTLRVVTKLDGALSGPAQAGPVAVALRYAREHAAALGLSASDVAGLRLTSRSTTTRGLTTLRFAQRFSGIPVFGNGLLIGLDRAGRVLTVSGSPAHLDAAPGSVPAMTPTAARRRAGRGVDALARAHVVSGPRGRARMTRFSDGSTASLVVFVIAGEGRLGWQVVRPLSGGLVYRTVIDARTGRLLYRASLTRNVSATIWQYYPGGPGPATTSVPLPAGWLDNAATTLSGPNAHVYSDVNDNDQADASEEVSLSSGNFDFAFTQYTPGSGLCATLQCSWDPANASSWPTNRKQDAAQVFWFVNTFHDHLAAAPIGFSAANGQPVFDGADRLKAESDDGANGPGGVPNADHINNANMTTPPNGTSPRMQMYLFKHGSNDPFNDVNGGDDAAIVYHEYTHGLSSRLITGGDGWEALDAAQSSAMAEAWSDWYAMDFLVDQGLQADDPSADGEVDLGAYTDSSPDQLRTQPMDCPVGSVSGLCPGSPLTGPGGYNYGDFGRVLGYSEPHADGEIWGETLWDLRAALTSPVAEQLITDGMRLSPPDPSFLDERNAILAADQADFGGAHQDALWTVFRHRGMGYYASTTGSEDTSPAEDFSGPPASGGDTGAVSGRVYDETSGLPLAGVLVGFGGHMSNPADPGYLAATAAADGGYAIANVPTGRYPELLAASPAGYDDGSVNNVNITPGATTHADLELVRDWAAAPGGAQLAATTGGSASGCGPGYLIDQSLAGGWSANRPTGGAPNPSATIQLPKAITMDAFAIDPGATCGDGASAALKTYMLEVSSDGTNWTPVSGSSFSAASGGHLNRTELDAAIDGVQYVRLTLLSAQGPVAAGYSALDHIDVSELAVYGAPPDAAPAGSLGVPATATPNQTVTLDASSFTDADSAITGYAWDFDGDGVTDAQTPTPTTTHAYAAGVYAPSVVVTDFQGAATGASATITVAEPSAPVTPVQPVRPRVVLLSQTKRGAVRARVTCAVACTATVQFTLTRSAARALHLGSRRAGRRIVKIRRGTTTLVVPLNAGVRARLHRSKLRSASVVVTLTVASGSQRARLLRTVRVLRP